MRSQTSGPITTLLIFVPLIAVPVLAVYGVPQLSSLAATTHEDEDLKFADMKTLDPTSSGKAAASGPGDAPLADSEPQRTAVQLGQPMSPRSRLDRLGESHAATARAEQTASISSEDGPWSNSFVKQEKEPSKPSPAAGSKSQLASPQSPAKKSKAATKTTAEHQQLADRLDSAPARGAVKTRPSTWQSAVDRLHALGIREYRVQPGQKMNGVHFSCQLTSRGNVRVSHRFEAEAADPLEAFENVLLQIDDWQRRSGEQSVDGRSGRQPGPAASLQKPVVSDAPLRSDIDVTTR